LSASSIDFTTPTLPLSTTSRARVRSPADRYVARCRKDAARANTSCGVLDGLLAGTGESSSSSKSSSLTTPSTTLSHESVASHIHARR
jgi:hypothetical protein